MKLHSLEVSAFGPYPESVRIDFDALAADGLFLLHGDTGAGKTSLLDAVAFALFGTVPGARQEANRLRSDSASPRTETRVTLEVTVGGQRLRLSRTPRYERAKARGTGTTVAQATATLSWVGSPPPGRVAGGTDRIPEVGLIVTELLGMNADQFFQVVLLPQGEFARFLRARTDEREELLERLFDTRRFGRVESWFADARRDSAAELRASGEELRRLAAQLAQAAGWRGDVPDAPGTDWACGVRDLVDARQVLAAQALNDAAGVRRETAAHHGRWFAAAARHQRLSRLRELQRSVALSEHDRQRWRAELEAAGRAAPVAAAADGWGRARAALAGERAAVERQATTVGLAAPDGDRDLVAAEDISRGGQARAASAAARDRAGRLAGLADEGHRQAEDVAAHAALADRIAEHGSQLASVDEDLSRLPAEIDVRTDRVERLRAVAATLDAASTAAAAAAATLRQVHGLVAATIRHQEVVDEAQRAVDLAQNVTARRLELTAARIHGMAAELASGLVAGQGCPVCGALDHPAPVASGGTPVTAADLDRAQRLEAEASAARREAQDARAAVERDVSTLATLLAGRTVAEVAAIAAEVERTRQSAAEAVAALPDEQSELRRLIGRRGDLDNRRRDLDVALAADRARSMPLAEAIDGRAARLAQAAGGHRSVADRRDALLVLAGELDTLDHAVQRRRAAGHAVEGAWEQVAAELARSGFDDLDTALAAAQIDAGTVTAALGAADAAAATVAGHLAELAVEPDDGTFIELPVEVVHATLAAAATAADDAAAAERSAFAADSVARERVRLVARLAAELHRAEERWAPAAAADAELGALTDVLLGRGSNQLHMSLRAYVLASWLREVATAANARLRVLTGGRYSFVHVAGREARGRAGGLGLEVLDQYSGRTRPTKTLSGGESFLASLALALGLADVVAARSGGSLLNTMFIDEGFGSLDAESLDLVMDTLDSLRGEGRMIGVVSHLDELRQRIPARLRVRRSAAGSSVEMSLAL